jgi:two-component system LytT family response regulator
MSLRVLIVDDEPLARERIRTLLAGEPDVSVAGECAGGEEALRTVRVERPDLVFLDVQMPGLDGFETVARLGELCGAAMPAVIFVTAYDKHAVRAFEVHALDYLLKPFDRARFAGALARARSHIGRKAPAGPPDDRIARLVAEREGVARRPRRLVIHDGGRIIFLPVSEIDWLEAAGNYVRIHAGSESYLHRETLRSLEARLDPEQFLRIGRSAIVRIDQVRELRPWFHGAFVVCLRDGTELQSSRGFSGRLRAFLGTS